MKLAINLHLNTILPGLAEVVHFASRHRLDLHRFQNAIAAGPMACDLTGVKISKPIGRDFSVRTD